MECSPVLSILIALAVILILVGIVLLFAHIANGFEITPQLKVEEAQLQMCILYHINNTTCDKIYGGIS